jgi:hypothetical protein
VRPSPADTKATFIEGGKWVATRQNAILQKIRRTRVFIESVQRSARPVLFPLLFCLLTGCCSSFYHPSAAVRQKENLWFVTESLQRRFCCTLRCSRRADSKGSFILRGVAERAVDAFHATAWWPKIEQRERFLWLVSLDITIFNIRDWLQHSDFQSRNINVYTCHSILIHVHVQLLYIVQSVSLSHN